jgi:hypothetical protein
VTNQQRFKKQFDHCRKIVLDSNLPLVHSSVDQVRGAARCKIGIKLVTLICKTSNFFIALRLSDGLPSVEVPGSRPAWE